MNAPLSGLHVVVTRPAGQAAHLAEALRAQGAKPVLFPVLAIHALKDITHLLELARRLDNVDLAIFVSANAIRHALDTLLAHRSWPVGLRVATIGKASEAVLAGYDLGGQEQHIIAPELRFDSEALLAGPELLAMSGRRVVIFRGDGGRELLGDTLLERGAQVEYVTCYQRSSSALDPAPLLKLWEANTLDAVTVTSSEGLHYLYEMLGRLGQAWLRKTPVFVPHARIEAEARHLGLHQLILTQPGDDGLLGGLTEYFTKQHGA